MKNTLIKIKKRNYGFTLVELLVVVSIIGILLALSVFSAQSTRKSGRDARRKSDIELIRSGIEIYKADCGEYPASLGESLMGSGSTNECLDTNEYIAEVPVDPSTGENYGYLRSDDGFSYELCAYLEKGGDDTCSESVDCGDNECNYKTTNP